MALDVWLTFALASFVLSVIPGPSVLVVTGHSIAHGWRAALWCIAGELLGGVCLMLASLLGVGAVVAASPLAFVALKWFGAGVLLYLGVKALWAAVFPVQSVDAEVRHGQFAAGFWTAVSNPKSLVFYLAFFTQFVDVSGPLVLQYMLLIGTAVVMAGMVLGGYALVAVRMKPFIGSASAQRKVSGVSGLLYLTGGVWVAIMR